MPEASTSDILDAEAVLELDLEGFKLIEASAGTGKTHTIADLYLRHILSGRQPSQILIVTYLLPIPTRQPKNCVVVFAEGSTRHLIYSSTPLPAKTLCYGSDQPPAVGNTQHG
jgi:hypothetical protein